MLGRSWPDGYRRFPSSFKVFLRVGQTLMTTGYLHGIGTQTAA